MSLLQISEPGLSPDPHMRRIAVGIDLGTTHSLVAAVRHGVAECLPDAQGQTLLPSAVRYLGGGRRAIGADALAAQAEDPLDTIVSVKRMMGRALEDVVGRERLPYRFVDRPGMVALDTREGVKTPVEISAEILAALRQRAGSWVGTRGCCVFRVAWGCRRRRTTTRMRAPFRAGLRRLTLRRGVLRGLSSA